MKSKTPILEKLIFLGLTIAVFAIWVTCAYLAFARGLVY